MNNILYYIGVIITINIHCNSISVLHTEGLPTEDAKMNHLLFLNDSCGFISGSIFEIVSNPNQESDTFAFSNHTSMLYRTLDGGKHWVGTEFGPGSIKKIVQNKHLLFAFKLTEYPFETTIYKSTDFGATWTFYDSFSNIATNIFHFADRNVIVGKTESGTFDLFEKSTRNSGWKALSARAITSEVIQIDGRIMYITQDSSGLEQLVVYYPRTKQLEFFNIPTDFTPYLLSAVDEKCFIVGTVNKNITGFVIDDSIGVREVFCYSEDNEIFPDGVWGQGDELMLVVGERRSHDVSHKIVKKLGEGKWQTVNFKYDNFIKPFFILHSSHAWFYSGAGRMQVLSD